MLLDGLQNGIGREALEEDDGGAGQKRSPERR